MGEDTDLVIMADDHFVEGFAVRFTVDAVLVVDGTGGTELLDNADCLFTDGGLRLLGAGTNVMRTINAGVLSNRVGEGDLLGACRLTIEDIRAEPEVRVGVEVCEKIFLVHDGAP